MKFGILTYHNVYNFGANLQVYSTVWYLKSHGYDPIIINWVAKDLEDGYNSSNPPEQVEIHRKFVNEYLPLTELCRTSDDIVRVIKNHDIKVVIIGSDAVLQHNNLLTRMVFTKSGIKFKPRRSNTVFPNPFWGSFISGLDKKIPVMVMSASSQNMNYKLIRGKLKQKINEALHQFDHITVRDEWTRKMISYFTKGKLEPGITPDPVFAYNQNVKEQLSKEEILKKFNLPDKYLLFSFKNKNIVNEEWLKSCQTILEKDNISSVMLTMPGGMVFKDLKMKVIGTPVSPLEWYALIKYSVGYIGENMHPIIVSLHNSVPFFAFDDYGIIKFKYFVNEESSKIHDILSIGGFLDNSINTLGKKYTCPSPDKVIKLIKNFDIEKCKRFGAIQQEKYNLMMENLLNLTKN